MECDICGKGLTAKAHVHCPTCARAALYPLRIEQAKILLERETLGQHVEAVVNGTEDRAGQAVSLGETLVDTHESSKRVAVERDVAEAEEIQERIRMITEQSELLKRQMEETRREIAARKAAIAQRRSDMESATYNVDKRRAKELDMVKEVIRTVKHADDIGHREDIRSKVWHCKHAAEVAGMKRRNRRSRDGLAKVEYYIGGGQVGAFNEWDEICPMGRNLYNLLIEDAKSTLNALEQEAARKSEPKNGTSGRPSGVPDVVMGYFSHGMSKGFLGSAEGANYLRGWKCQTAMKVVDKVKGHLQAEMQGAEWEVLDEKEWEMDEEAPQGADRVGEMKKVSSGTKLTSTALGNGSTDEGQGKSRGWTKLKSRSDEAK
ncbi:hypothetical protein UCRNP2_1051 [Neofusicoccum parvum UCRNP2]|uniref:Autophagy-related protein 14 n=1 Tax=Botryosphaeria parva (strain UCR-NP2) TaxID=1287680 RepID=R1GKH9_BOTPV|nr:hypothetical protein UCRNP2_1051 [Neofusicoccum parvum UCRNP2]